jgi:putative transposase
MGSKGNCYDNAVCEASYGTLEKELLRRRSLRTRQDARTAIFDCIETWCNRCAEWTTDEEIFIEPRARAA